MYTILYSNSSQKCNRSVNLKCSYMCTQQNRTTYWISNIELQQLDTALISDVLHLIRLLKPQDSFGKKDKTFSWSAESAAHSQKTLINLPLFFLPALVLNDVCSCNNVKWLNIAMYITYGRVFRGTPKSEHFDIWVVSWKWKQFGMNNEQGIYSSYRSIKSCTDKTNDLF